MAKMTRRALFARLLSAIAAVPLVGRIAARVAPPPVVTPIPWPKIIEDPRMPRGMIYFISDINWESKTVLLSADSEGEKFYPVLDNGSQCVIRNLTIPDSDDD